jgi:hypothetical protein
MYNSIISIFNKFENIDEKIKIINQNVLNTYMSILYLCLHIAKENKNNKIVSLLYTIYSMFLDILLHMTDFRLNPINQNVTDISEYKIQTGGMDEQSDLDMDEQSNVNGEIGITVYIQELNNIILEFSKNLINNTFDENNFIKIRDIFLNIWNTNIDVFNVTGNKNDDFQTKIMKLHSHIIDMNKTKWDNIRSIQYVKIENIESLVIYINNVYNKHKNLQTRNLSKLAEQKKQEKLAKAKDVYDRRFATEQEDDDARSDSDSGSDFDDDEANPSKTSPLLMSTSYKQSEVHGDMTGVISHLQGGQKLRERIKQLAKRKAEAKAAEAKANGSNKYLKYKMKYHQLKQKLNQ